MPIDPEAARNPVLLAFGRLATSSVTAFHSEKSVSWPRFSGNFSEMPCQCLTVSFVRFGLECNRRRTPKTRALELWSSGLGYGLRCLLPMRAPGAGATLRRGIQAASSSGAPFTNFSEAVF